MKAKDLIAALLADDPEGERDVFVCRQDQDEDYIITAVSGYITGPDRMLYVELACRICKKEGAENDDSYDGCCPSCADEANDLADLKGISFDEAANELGEAA